MEVILLEKVQNLGNLGDRVSVRSGYGRNYLVPKGKAAPATKANLADFETRRAELERGQADVLAAARARAEGLAELHVTIARKSGDEGRLFGSVGAADIADAVTSAGIAIEKREVRLPEGPLRVTGEHQVAIHFHADVDASVTVEIVPE